MTPTVRLQKIGSLSGFLVREIAAVDEPDATSEVEILTLLNRVDIALMERRNAVCERYCEDLYRQCMEFSRLASIALRDSGSWPAWLNEQSRCMRIRYNLWMLQLLIRWYGFGVLQIERRIARLRKLLEQTT